MSLFQHLQDDNGIWSLFIDDKELYEVGQSHIAGSYRVSLVNQFRPRIGKSQDWEIGI